MCHIFYATDTIHNLRKINYHCLHKRLYHLDQSLTNIMSRKTNFDSVTVGVDITFNNRSNIINKIYHSRYVLAGSQDRS